MNEPNGCAVCGKPERGHAIEWFPNVGLHTWQEPTDAQRLERMKKRLDTGTA